MALLMAPSNDIRTIETKTKFVWVHNPDTESGVGGCDENYELTIILDERGFEMGRRPRRSACSGEEGDND